MEQVIFPVVSDGQLATCVAAVGCYESSKGLKCYMIEPSFIEEGNIRISPMMPTLAHITQ